MVISVLSSQDIEFFKDNPSPVYSFVDDVTKMVDIAPLKAKKRPCNEVQEGVKVKCCDYNFEPSVNHLKYMSPPWLWIQVSLPHCKALLPARYVTLY